VVDNPGSLGESIGLKAVDKTPHTLLFHLKRILKQVETTNRYYLEPLVGTSCASQHFLVLKFNMHLMTFELGLQLTEKCTGSIVNILINFVEFLACD
jgi:hypothetical protein